MASLLDRITPTLKQFDWLTVHFQTQFPDATEPGFGPVKVRDHLHLLLRFMNFKINQCNTGNSTLCGYKEPYIFSGSPNGKGMLPDVKSSFVSHLPLGANKNIQVSPGDCGLRLKDFDSLAAILVILFMWSLFIVDFINFIQFLTVVRFLIIYIVDVLESCWKQSIF